MGIFDFAEKAAKSLLTEVGKKIPGVDQQIKLDSLRNLMRTYMKRGDIGENELASLKSTAANIGMDAYEFEMRFDMVRSARDEYNSQRMKNRSESPDLFFYSEREIEEFFDDEGLDAIGAKGINLMAALKNEQKKGDEMRRPHFDTAFDEAFSSVRLAQESPVQQQSQQPQMTPPPMPSQVQYTLNINGQNQGPYDMQQLQQMVQSGQLTRQTYVWKQGMANWEVAGNVQELSLLFGAVPPPPPSI